MRATRIITALAAIASSAVMATPLNRRDDDGDCATQTFGTICQPRQDSDDKAIGNHINLSLLLTGLPFSKAVSVKLLSEDGTETQLEFYQVAQGDTPINNPSTIVTSRQGLLIAPTYPNAFQASFQFPCSLFDDGKAQGTFDYRLTHYYGSECASNNTAACIPLIKDIPPVLEPRQVLIKDNAEICNRNKTGY